VFLTSLLRNAAAHIFPRLSRSSKAVQISTATPSPSPQPIPSPRPRRTRRLVNRIEARLAVVPDPKTQTVARPKRRPYQVHPMLFSVKSRDPWQKVFCGPTAVAAAIGADVDEVMRVIQQQRNNHRPVVGTDAGELRQVLQHFGHDLQFVADFSSDSPTLARWERARTDWEFDQALIVTVTGHWVAVRGRWFCDTWSGGKPVRLSDVPQRRKRVRFVYSVVLINQNRVQRDDRTGRIIRCRELSEMLRRKSRRLCATC